MIKWRFLALFVFFPAIVFSQGFASFDGQDDYAIMHDTLLPKGDFTTEFFFRICDSTSSEDMVLFSTGNFECTIQPDSAGQSALIVSHGIFERTVFLPPLSQSDWQHLAITYRSVDSIIRIFHNGSFTDTYQRKVVPDGTFLLSDSVRPFQGFIDEFRVSATTIYTTSFSISYAELPQTAMTLRLFGFDSLDNSTFLDENTLDTLYPMNDSLWRAPIGMTSIDSVCEGSTLRLIASGAASYSWNSNEGATVYDIFGNSSNVRGPMVLLSITDTGSVHLIAEDSNQCRTRISQDIYPLPVPKFTLGNDTTICQSDSFAIAIQGYPGYQWSDGDTFSHNFIGQQGWHWLEITDENGCQYRDSLWATVIPNPVVNLGNDTTLLPGYSMHLDAGPGFASYNWSTSETSQRILVTLSKEYRVTVTDSNGCQGIDDIVVFIDASSVEGQSNKHQVSIFPNPVQDYFTVKNVDANSSIYLYNLNGRLMYRKEIKRSGDVVISIDNFNPGIYLVEINNASFTTQQKVIKAP